MNRRDAARRKILGILPRAAIEELSGLEKPWHAAKPDLIECAIKRWDSDAVREKIDFVFKRAA